METLEKVVDFCIRHQTILGCSTVSLLTAASEHIFSSLVFKCPCNSRNMVYGASFLLAPAFVLFLLGFMVNASTWHLFTGKCSVEKHREYSPWGTYACFCQVLVPLIAKALVAPLTWIAVALLGASYYECAASGSSLMEYFYCRGNGTDCPNQLLKVPCDEELSAKISSERLSLHAQSQDHAKTPLTCISFFQADRMVPDSQHHDWSTDFNMCQAMLLPGQLSSSQILRNYSKKEEELFETKAKEHATKLAERNINCFFDTADPAPFSTPRHEDWQKISIWYTYNSKEQYYSMLHKYVNTKTGNSAKCNVEGQDHTESANGNEAHAYISRM